MAIVNSRAAIEPKTGKAAIFVNEIIHSLIRKLFANNEQGFAYDPNDLSTMFQDAAGTVPVTGAGQPVGLILDKSGRNNHAYQTTSSSRPILRKNATTGAYYLEFDGSDDFLQTSNIDFTGTDKVSLFVGLYMSKSVLQMIMETSTNYVANVGAFELNSGEIISGGYVLAYRAANNTNQYSYQPVKPTPRSSVIAGKINMGKQAYNADGGVLLRENATSTGNIYSGSHIGGAFGSYPLYIGRRGGTALPFNGHIYSLIGVGKLASDNETVSIEKELAKRTGVTLSV